MSDRPTALACNDCGSPIHRGRGEHYEIGIVAACDPNDPVLDSADIANATSEIQALLSRLSDEPVVDAQNSVRQRIALALCLPCAKRWLERVTQFD